MVESLLTEKIRWMDRLIPYGNRHVDLTLLTALQSYAAAMVYLR